MDYLDNHSKNALMIVTLANYFVEKLPQNMTDITFLGLSQKENKIYETLLTLGEASAKTLASRTRLDRTSVYDICERLLQKRLVFKKEKGKILQFSAHHPKNLLLDLKRKEEQLSEALPDLIRSYVSAKTVPLVRVYTGDEELLTMYDSLLTIKGLKTYDIICSEQDWLRMNPRFFERFKKARAARGIHTRLIMETSTTGERRKKDERMTHSDVKLLPAAFSSLQFSAGCYILPDRVIFVSYRREHAATEIFSHEIVNFMQTIFNFMWKVIA